jgi:hypothetical protein
VLDKLPSELTAGDTWAWTRSLGDYPAPTWVATVYFENADGTFNAAASASGTDHAFSITAATTATKQSGRYFWSVRVTSGVESYTVESGWLEVLANPAAAGNRDPRSDARKMLDALNDTLLGRATADQLAMTINGRSISRTPLEELRAWRDQLRSEVNADEASTTAGKGRTIKLRFKRA